MTLKLKANGANLKSLVHPHLIAGVISVRLDQQTESTGYEGELTCYQDGVSFCNRWANGYNLKGSGGRVSLKLS